MFGVFPIWTSWKFEYHKELKLIRTTVECEETGKDQMVMGAAVELIDIVMKRFDATLYPELLLNLNEALHKGRRVTFSLIFKSDEAVTEFKNFLLEEFFPK